VTTEDDFHEALDALIADWRTRLVFADWLEERGDPRAEGYRALGLLRLYPDLEYHLRYVYRAGNGWTAACSADRSVLPADWYEPLKGVGELELLSNESRRSAEDKAARAFTLLPPERRAALLAGSRASEPG
jgi:uncharacterized protein (TIGR02996 family)